MGAPRIEENHKTESKLKNPNDTFDGYYTEELVIALCGQLGTNLNQISKELKDILEDDYGYTCEEIKLSEFLFKGKPASKDSYHRILDGMDYGDALRLEHKNNGVLSSLAISKIQATRVTETEKQNLDTLNFKSRRKCFIINSVKHPEEVIALEKVYESSFYLVGVFSSQKEKIAHLESIIPKRHFSKIPELILRDDDDKDASNGQKLRNVFTKSDYFIKYGTNNQDLKDKVNRFVSLIFDFGINTPSKDENAMFQATAASANSACLSRQVGACITDKRGEILSIGWNDVPKYGGGVYLDSDKNDQRCFCDDWKCCTSSNKKDGMVSKILTELKGKSIIESKEEDGISKKTIDQEKLVKSILELAGIKDLIEFGRSVHAEMNAIIIGSQQTGDKMREGKLYCTTFPCHNCARHIIMAGIKDVYYIEPYSKSLCLELHKDVMTEDESAVNMVRLLMYEGAAPKSFIKFYKLVSDNRKTKIKNGQDKKSIKPKYQVHLESLYEKETHYLKFATKSGIIQE